MTLLIFFFILNPKHSSQKSLIIYGEKFFFRFISKRKIHMLHFKECPCRWCHYLMFLRGYWIQDLLSEICSRWFLYALYLLKLPQLQAAVKYASLATAILFCISFYYASLSQYMKIYLQMPYCLLMDGLAKTGCIDEARSVFNEMKEKCVKPGI